MASKKSAAAAVADPKAKANTIKVKSGIDGFTDSMSKSEMLAKLATTSSLAGSSIKAYARCGDDLEISDLLAELRSISRDVSGGNLARIEGMLTKQAVTLDNVFHNLLLRASSAEYMKNLETYMRLAMKAQAQARATAEALAMMKNPQPYIKQTNIAAGPQQVNNASYAIPSSHTTRPENSEGAPNKLLEAQHGERLDFGAQAAAGGADQAVAAVAKVDRAEI